MEGHADPLVLAMRAEKGKADPWSAVLQHEPTRVKFGEPHALIPGATATATPVNIGNLLPVHLLHGVIGVVQAGGIPIAFVSIIGVCARLELEVHGKARQLL